VTISHNTKKIPRKYFLKCTKNTTRIPQEYHRNNKKDQDIQQEHQDNGRVHQQTFEEYRIQKYKKRRISRTIPGIVSTKYKGDCQQVQENCQKLQQKTEKQNNYKYYKKQEKQKLPEVQEQPKTLTTTTVQIQQNKNFQAQRNKKMQNT